MMLSVARNRERVLTFVYGRKAERGRDEATVQEGATVTERRSGGGNSDGAKG